MTIEIIAAILGSGGFVAIIKVIEMLIKTRKELKEQKALFSHEDDQKEQELTQDMWTQLKELQDQLIDFKDSSIEDLKQEIEDISIKVKECEASLAKCQKEIQKELEDIRLGMASNPEE